MFKHTLLITCGFLIGAVAMHNKHYFYRQVPVPVALLADGGEYEGELKNDLLHGRGRIVWPDGSYYEGDFHRGLFHGRGRLDDDNGAIYRGQFQRGRATGNGDIRYADGRSYQGEVKNGMPHGYGILTSKKATYTGNFKHGHFDGYGELITAAGASYGGGFERGIYHGKGVYVAEDGGRYTGSFVQGQFTGKGSFEQGQVRYEGDFVDWLFHGDGIYHDGVGGRYTGQFSHHQLQGKGEYFAIDGRYYKGEFVNFQFHGEGYLVTGEGDQYRGEFDRGQYHGRGHLRHARALDGIRETTGRWDSGILVEADEYDGLVDPKAIIERALYNQQQLLANQWQQLTDNDTDKIDLYFLGIAGDGSQGVFRREVLSVKAHFDQHYHTQGRSTALINGNKAYETHPLATKTSIQLTLNAIAERMDKNNDILFIYMSSHGAEDFHFHLHQQSAAFGDLSAGQLDTMLDALPIRWKVIVISACYSGGFIPVLKDNSTLIITAAAADKTSFGCSDHAEYTYFSEAFFREALPAADSFVDAFDRAKVIVAEREAQSGYEPSNPQIHKPIAIMKQLALWREQWR